MIIGEQPTGEMVKEVYAQFGLAYYLSGVLHSGICNFLAISDIGEPRLMTRGRMDEKLAEAYAMTTGEAIKRLAPHVSKALYTKLEAALEARNFLAHQFWFERCHRMYQTHHIQVLLEELASYSQLFEEVDAEMNTLSSDKRKGLGITEANIELISLQLISGVEKNAIVGKDVVKHRNRFLKRPQKLVKIWNADSSLVFEFTDGSLWQPCELGLGWSSFERAQENWSLNPQLSPHLPTEIIPRPQGCLPWNYSFQLANGMELSIEPSDPPCSYRWHLAPLQT